MRRGAAPFLLAALTSSLCLAQGPAPELIQKFAPQYPMRAMDRGIEGWVEVAFTIDADGSVSGAKVTAAAPEDTFDKAVLNAVSKWRYAPANDGRPQASVAVLSFSLLATGSARQETIDLLAKASKDIQERRLEDAAKTIDKLADTEGLTLMELALLERVRGVADYTAGRYVDAARRLNRQLEILGERMEPGARTAAAQTLAMAHLNAGAFPAAVAIVDRWIPGGVGMDSGLAATIESVRRALAEGRPIRLAPSP